MKCQKCNKKMFTILTEYTFMFEGNEVKATNVPALHCDCCGSTYIDEEVKERVKEFAQTYLSGNTLDYAECETAEIVALTRLLL